MSINTLKLKVCPKCGEPLSYTSYEGYCAIADCLWNNDECSSPGQEDQSARLAASAEVGQVEGTITDEQLCAWYESLTDEYMTFLYEKYGANTPRQAWAADKHGTRTLRCSHCDSSNLEEFCHEPPFVRFRCQHCACGMDKELNVISQPRLIEVGISEVPVDAIVMGFLEQDDGLKYPFGYARGQGYFMCDRDGWAMWPDLEGMLRAFALRMLEQGA